jgi:mono/diheme cytochrome c family protein
MAGACAFASLAVVSLAACDDESKPNFEYAPDMVSSIAYDTYATNPNTRDGRTLMKPPVGTVPRGYAPVLFGPGPEEATRAGRELTNPLADNELVRKRGDIAFQRWCSPCHGREGAGDGPVTRKFPRPPSLVAPHARGLADGQLFHIVTFGQGVMPPYGQAVMADDRWKIVRALRALQTAAVPVATSPATTPPAVAPPAVAPPAVAPPAVTPAAASPIDAKGKTP